MSMFYKGFLLRIFLIISPCSISIICTKENKSNHIPVRETTHFATNIISVLHLLKLTEISYMRRPAGIHNVPLHFLKLYNEHFPKRRVKTKYDNRKTWLSEGLKLSIRTKNKLYLTYVKLKYLRNELRYTSYRNKLNHTLRIAERNYYAELLAKHKSNLKKVWGVLKVLSIKIKQNECKKNSKFMTILLLRIEMSPVLASTIILLKLGRTLRKKPESGHSTKILLEGGYGQFNVFCVSSIYQ